MPITCPRRANLSQVSCRSLSAMPPRLRSGPKSAGGGSSTAVRAACLTIFGIAVSRISRLERRLDRRPCNKPSMVLPEGASSDGSGNADSQRKVWSFRGNGSCHPSRRDSGCVFAHPASWRASASYRPLRAVWAVCAWALRGCARSPEPFSAQKSAPAKGIFQ
jgi:hypothetical protein